MQHDLCGPEVIKVCALEGEASPSHLDDPDLLLF